MPVKLVANKVFLGIYGGFVLLVASVPEPAAPLRRPADVSVALVLRCLAIGGTATAACCGLAFGSTSSIFAGLIKLVP